MVEGSPSTSSTHAEPDFSGRQIGDYRILRRLGRGAMAEVYLAEQASLHRQIALKVLKSDLASDHTYVKRFQMEARAAASLVHANIVQIYEVGESDGIHFIAQEYVQGQNLAEFLARSGPLSVSVGVGIMRQVCAALAKAAERGIVHRDIKPENLMLSGSGEVKVADFGLARITQNPDQLKLTQVGVTMGSPLYMSPEQAEGKALDTRSDIYSLGVTCYQMLSGRPPFTGDSPLSVAVQHLKVMPDRLENFRADAPAGLCRIIHKMLSKNPDDRYGNSAEVLRELRDLPVEGMDGSWSDELEQFNTSEMLALSAARTAATQQLASVMSTDARPTPLVRQRLFWAALCGALCFGVLLAWPKRQPSLLDVAPEIKNSIPTHQSAEAQYLYAMTDRTEEGWQSVIDGFPQDESFNRLARKQLAELYLTQDRFDEAARLFDEFVRIGETEPEYLAYGLAGQYIVATLQSDSKAAAERFAQWWPSRTVLEQFDSRMTRQVYQLARKSRQLLDQKKDVEIEQWLDRHLQEEDASGGA